MSSKNAILVQSRPTLSSKSKGFCTRSNLASVSVRAGVGHTQGERPIVPKLGTNFVLELAAPDGLAASADTRGITRLDHELLDHLQMWIYIV